MLIEQLQCNLLFRWFVVMEMDEGVWNHAVYSKNRDPCANHPFFVEKVRDIVGLYLNPPDKALVSQVHRHLHSP
jgi:transposase